jgi:hypothetical protein
MKAEHSGPAFSTSMDEVAEQGHVHLTAFALRSKAAGDGG